MVERRWFPWSIDLVRDQIEAGLVSMALKPTGGSKKEVLAVGVDIFDTGGCLVGVVGNERRQKR